MEDQAVEEICREFLSDPEPNIIIHITTDGDSTAFRGAEKAMAEQGHVVEEALGDTRHLAQSQKKAAAQMFPGRTAADRQSTKRKFSVDFMKTCTAEYDQVIRKQNN